MTITRILTIVTLLIAVALAGYLVSRVKAAIDLENQIASIESQVIDKLKIIREAQEAFQSVNERYTADWGELKEFMTDGTLYIIERTEEIITLDYGADSIVVHIDTLDTVPVWDSLFAKYERLDLGTLAAIPGNDTGKEFEMFADKITKGNLTVDVVEVRDVDPVDPTRKEDNPNNRKPLRFGSRTEVTTAGNWE